MTTVYTPEEVAEKLKLHINTVWRYLKTGLLPASRIGNRYRVTEEQLLEFLERTSTESQALEVREPKTTAAAYGRALPGSEQRKQRISAFGKHKRANRTSEDFMREKHKEAEEECRREERHQR